MTNAYLNYPLRCLIRCQGSSMVMRALRFKPSITSMYSWELLKYWNIVPADMIMAIMFVDRSPRTRHPAYRPARGGRETAVGRLLVACAKKPDCSLSNLISMITRDEPTLQ